MSRADRLRNDPNWLHDSTACEGGAVHQWQPISFVFESQLLDHDGRVLIRQPSIEEGRVYCVCMVCHSHTYIITEWAGYFIPSPEVDRREAQEEAEYRRTPPHET